MKENDISAEIIFFIPEYIDLNSAEKFRIEGLVDFSGAW